MATPVLTEPPNVPRSCIVVPSHRTAWTAASVVDDQPVTWPASFIATPPLNPSSASVPRSCIVVPSHRKA